MKKSDKLGAIITGALLLAGGGIIAHESIGKDYFEKKAIDEASNACKAKAVQLIDNVTSEDNNVAMYYTFECYSVDKNGNRVGNRLLTDTTQALSDNNSAASYEKRNDTKSEEIILYRLFSSDSQEGFWTYLNNGVVSYMDNNCYKRFVNERNNVDLVASNLRDFKEFIAERSVSKLEHTESWIKTQYGYVGTYRGSESNNIYYNIAIDVKDGKVVGITNRCNGDSNNTEYQTTYNFKYLTQEEYDSAFKNLHDTITPYFTPQHKGVKR